MNLKKMIQNTSMQTKLILPILLFALLGMYVGTKVIENALVEQIFHSQKQEIKNYSNKIYYILRSDYRTLFFEFGKDKRYFKQAEEAAQKEAVNNLHTLLADTGYCAFMITPNETIPLAQTDNFDEKKLTECKNTSFNKVEVFSKYFSYKLHFKPWNWEIIVLKETTQFEQIVAENKKLVALSIFFLLFGIVVFLLIVLYQVIQKPFAQVFAHLDAIKNKHRDIAPLELHTTKEVIRLGEHINSMYSSIVTREQELREEKERNENILNSQTSIVLVSSGERLERANKAFFEFFSEYPSVEDFLQEHQCVCDFFEKTQKKNFVYKREDHNWIEEVLDAKGVKRVLIKRGAQEFVFDINAKLLSQQHDQYVINMTDITTLEHYKEQLEFSHERLNNQLHTDELTKLPNRLALSEKVLEQNIVSLIFINIDGFKEINDFYGVQTGDKVLCEFADLLTQFTSTRRHDIFRLAGDEFAIYISYEYKRDAIVTFVAKMLTQIASHDFYDISNKRKINLTATAGIVVRTQSASAFVNADIALKTAKKQKKPFMSYDESEATKDEFGANLEWANKLKIAFENDCIVPYFQPIYNNKTHKIEKYEALVRLIDEENKPIAPFFFLDVAKRSHQYFQLTETMLRKTFEYFKDYEHEFSINLCESDLADYSMNDYIINLLERYQFGSRVVFEIVETESINDYELVKNFIKRVKEHDAKIAIDDFGSGFSNFQHISELDLDYLKIDGSLIQNILIDPHRLAIVETISNFAKRLGIKTIAEFVDSKEVQDKIVELGIDYTQGYFISPPKASVA
jgi:c-di-GMP phosphodiesterase